MHPKPENTAKKNKAARWLTDAIFYLAILFFIIGFNFSDRMAGNWYQQFLPNIGSRSIQDIFFLDSLTGWAVTNATNQLTDTIFVLKTTNSGDNWSIQYRKVQTGGGFPGYNKIYFINQTTGFNCSVTGADKTTDGGNTWTSINNTNSFQDISVISSDTIWIVSVNSLTGGVFRTTNGGASWQNQLNLGSQNPNHIYFYNQRIGFCGKYGSGGIVKKTNDGGISWITVDSGGFNGFTDMHFFDSLKGWRTYDFIKNTTDGGLTWNQQTIPFGGNIIGTSIKKVSAIGNDSLMGAYGGEILWNNGTQTRDVLYRTTNGGVNWLFQIPDTSLSFSSLSTISFINRLVGWTYAISPIGLHTTTGGDPIWYTPITQISSEVPKEFALSQNYPNPFNPTTKIKYSVKRQTSNVKLIVFDILGKQIAELVNHKATGGTYEVVFDGSAYSSGIYLYSLLVDGKPIETKKMLMVK